METKSKIDKALILDFDHTCYDTDAFLLHEIREPMLSHFNIPVEKWEQAYRAAADIGYLPEQHLQELNKIMQPAPCSLEEILDFAASINFDKYLFSDVLPVLKDAKEKGYKIMILSFGAIAWQNKKVLGVGLDKAVDDIEYVTKDENRAKTEAIRKYGIRCTKVIFVDNKGSNLDEVHRTLPHVKTYLISRVPDEAMNFDNDEEIRIKYLESRRVAAQEALPVHVRCHTFEEIDL